MASIDPSSDWKTLITTVGEKLPASWHPRRPQPEWDRAFSGSAEINDQFGSGADKARTWALEALAFSDAVREGFGGMEGVVEFSRTVAKEHGPKGKNQFDS